MDSPRNLFFLITVLFNNFINDLEKVIDKRLIKWAELNKIFDETDSIPKDLDKLECWTESNKNKNLIGITIKSYT